ncbi:hypothetical protein GCK72_003379 [Caenorhabditis remanei]|uniref:Uncharacterized protein n=1 Tax=Caenorhabditis remanei TaxID=31234 RepID=A0A6A5HYU4_CAERE|nr:hypothetical protein GCK72_003379 [Caenorhabditis remanei]KAF1771552.1 hypothetical protein GCK72_003379 [Caenorhabditis remanei]
MGPFNAKKVDLLLGNACPITVDVPGTSFFKIQTPEPLHIMNEKCAKKPSELLGECETKKEVPNCDEVVREGVEQFCKEHNTSPACDWLATTTTESSKTLFIIIGAVVGGVLILAIAIGLFFYCRSKKNKLAGKKGQGTTGATDGGTTESGTAQPSGMTSTPSGVQPGKPNTI